ncbi:SGNH/GDSL hydrolase family protein [Nocardioides sp. CER19]|uniref:SGNH/GDSL hydrolase family protein n=1 Tax=Nocardioides sp. CER19 TaxID=3038538 RepID=UPI002449617E|nr:SGNH/GDSL hydrolase family protein [Nocardioides sp. CER19]MDH2413165.1 SGNH/GDSL hydrolase family protein [Nocardioides sp. CER19]
MPGRSLVAHRRRHLAGPLALALLAVLVLCGCSAHHGRASADGPTPAPVPPSSSGSAGSPAAAPRFTRYVAIGDSYTAAPGVPGEQSDDGCLRSSGNYPHLLAAALPVARLVDVSCSGADTSDVRHPQLDRIAPQLDAVTRDTDLVTIGLGGNDEDLFHNLLVSCLARQSNERAACSSFGSGVPSVLDGIERNLVAVVRAVRTKAPAARVLLIGYPQVAPAGGRCAQRPLANVGDPQGRQVNRGLTEAVRRAATATRATYVDVWTASAGHDLCAADPWINDLSGPGAAPFHPFAAEQAAVARLVEAAVM